MIIPKISVCIATKNSEKTIESCLKSVRNLADEIIILDCNSIDETLNICQNYSAIIYKHNFKGFAELKNTLIKKAGNNWILILDSDEEVSPELQKEIIDNLQKNENVVAYYITILNYMFGKKTHNSILKPRLAKRDAIKFGGKYVHERIQIKDEYVKKTCRLRNPILHHAYSDVSEYFTKFQQYTSLESLKFMDEGKNLSLLKSVIIGLGMFAYLLFWKRGILDGYRGLFFASMSFQYQLVIHAKVQDLKRLTKENPKGWREIWIERHCQR